MTNAQKDLVQQSWAQVMPISHTAATLFYSRLFILDPNLRHLFRSPDMAEQGRKLMQMLTVVVKGLDRLDQLIPAVQALGRRHTGYGVRDYHYETVAEALLWTLQQGLGEAFTAEVRQAWVEAYTVLADVMKAAAAAAEPVAA
jgi:hemoglobin-like flavoprotein